MLDAIQELSKLDGSGRPEKVRNLEKMGSNVVDAYESISAQFSEISLQNKDVTPKQSTELFEGLNEYRELCLAVQDADHFAGIPGYHPRAVTEKSTKQPLLQLPSLYFYINGFEGLDKNTSEAIRLLDVVWLGIPMGGITTDKLAQIIDPKAFKDNWENAILKLRKLFKNSTDLLSRSNYPGKTAVKVDTKHRALGGYANLVLEEEKKANGELDDNDWASLAAMIYIRKKYLTDLLKPEDIEKISQSAREIEFSLQNVVPESRPTDEELRIQYENLFKKLNALLNDTIRIDASVSYQNFLRYHAKQPERALLLEYLDKLNAQTYKHKSNSDETDILITGLEIFWINATNREMVISVSDLER
jgi:hypothetical protein